MVEDSIPSDDIFTIKDSQEYLAGHIIVGIVSWIKVILPVSMWYGWRKKTITDSSTNPWFSWSWETMWIGAIVTHGL